MDIKRIATSRIPKDLDCEEWKMISPDHHTKQIYIATDRIQYLCCGYSASKGTECEIVSRESKNRLLIKVCGSYHKVKRSKFLRLSKADDR